MIVELDVAVCPDPRDVLARLAAYHGERAVDAFTGHYGVDLDELDAEDVRRHLADPGRVAIDGHVAAEESRIAWRFALAGVRLDEAARMAELLRQIDRAEGST